jgi:hypothetical protein
MPLLGFPAQLTLRTVAHRSIALALDDVGANELRTEYAYPNAKRYELRSEALRHADDRMLARTLRIKELSGRNAGH